MWRLLAGVLAVICVVCFGQHGLAAGELLEEPNFRPPPPEDCNDKPCQHSGNCIDIAGGYSCKCAAGYAGKNCESGVWSTWTAWSQCGEGCEQTLSKRTRTCTTGDNCIGDHNETVTCPRTSCSANEESRDGSVVVEAKGFSVNLNNPDALKAFYRAIASFINVYCNNDKEYCCRTVLRTVVVNPAGTELKIVVGDFTYMGIGSPSTNPGGTLEVTLTFKGYRSELDRQCRSSGRRKRKTEQLQYVDKYFIAEALKSDIGRLEQIFNATILSVYPINETSSSSPSPYSQETTNIIAGVIGIITLMVVILMIVTIFILMRVQTTPSFKQSKEVQVSSIPPRFDNYRRRRYVYQ